MRWQEILAEVATLEHSGDTDAVVTGVQYDSRRVQPGDLFVAMRGGTTDGNQYLEAALAKGASAVLTDSPQVFAALKPRAVALVAHGRRALAEASAAVFGHPERKLHVSAVTGTNGKTTTAFLLEQMLTSVGRKCLLIGTIETRIAGKVKPSEHTTPEARDLYVLFAEAVEAGCTEVVMEMSSHALEQERVWGIPVDVAIFTNLTQDHLDYHGSMEAYAAAKAKLFAGVGAPPPRVAIIHRTDAYAPMMLTAASGAERIVTYEIGSDPGNHGPERWIADKLDDSDPHGISFLMHSPADGVRLHTQLRGAVNVLNLMAAMAAAMARGLDFGQTFASATFLDAVPGRFQSVANDLGFTVVVDYAHTDDALTNLIRIARDSARGGRIITLFGCGGDRDRTKRPKMGRAAGADSDFVVVTSDNPRSEDPMEIINEVLPGVRETHATFVVEPDRRAAIEVAIRAAKPGDIVLLAGKGHEKEQIFANGAVHFDDVEEAERILRMMEQERSA